MQHWLSVTVYNITIMYTNAHLCTEPPKQSPLHLISSSCVLYKFAQLKAEMTVLTQVTADILGTTVSFAHYSSKGVDWVFVEHGSYDRPGGLYGDENGVYGDNQVFVKHSRAAVVTCVLGCSGLSQFIKLKLVLKVQ